MRPIPKYSLLFATSGHSGVDRIVKNLINEFANIDANFDLLSVRDHGPYIDILPDNFRRVALPVAHRTTVMGPLVYYMLKEKPTSLLCDHHRLNRAALWARRVTRSPARIVIRMGKSLTGYRNDLGFLRGSYMLSSMRFWYPKADAVIVPSEGLRDEMIRYCGIEKERLHVISNPIVTPEFPTLSKMPVSDKWFNEGQPPIILATGSLEPLKDFATLIRAFSIVRSRRSCRLIILGEGRERRKLEDLVNAYDIDEDVRIPGFECNPYRFMSRASVFVLCSMHEGSGAVLVEALACGTPVVSTDCPVGPAEILQNGTIGPLVPVGNADALANAIDDILEQPPDSETLKAAAEPFRSGPSAARYLAAMGVSAGNHN